MSKRVRPGDLKRQEFDPVALFDSAAGWRKAVIVTVFLLVILSILMPELIFQNKIFLVPDTKAPISFQEVGRESLMSGTYPLWNPYIFCGMPSYHSLAYAPFVYPVSFVTYILQNYLGFPEMTWFLIHYLMAAVGVYLLLRSFGVRSSVSLLAGTLFMIMPNFLASGANGHGSKICAIAYMPFAFLFCRNILNGNRRMMNAALLAIILGFQMLRGHIQISYYTFLLIGALFLFESVHLFRTGKGREVAVILGFIFASMVMALGIASVLVFPVRDYAEYSIRGGGGLDYGYATGWSLHPKELLTFIFPWAFGFGKDTYWGKMPFTVSPNYLGVLTAVFSVVGMMVIRSRWKWYLLIIMVVSTIISFGRFFPVLYDPMFRFFPFFNKFRVPVMIIIVQQLAAVVLMGMGIEEYLRLASRDELPRPLRKDRIKWLLIGSVVLFLLVVAGAKGIQRNLLESVSVRGRVRPEWIRMAVSAYTGDLARTVFFFVAAVFSLFFVSWKKTGGGLVVAGLMVLLIFDMFTVDYSILHPDRSWNADGYRIIRPVAARESYKKPNKVAEYLAGDPSLFRIFPVPVYQPGRWGHSIPLFNDNSFMMSGIYSIGGYHAAKLKNYQDVMDVMFASFNRRDIPRQIIDMLGVKYFVSIYPVFPEGSEFNLVYESEKTYIYKNPGALPRVFFVDKIKVMPLDDTLTALVSNTFDPAREVILQSVPDGIIESAEGSSATITDYSLNSVSMDVHVEKPCIMVVSEIDYPDWRVTVDGKEEEILTANYCLRALPLAAGDHEVVFRFVSPILRKALAVSVLSLAIALFAAVFSAIITGRKGN